MRGSVPKGLFDRIIDRPSAAAIVIAAVLFSVTAVMLYWFGPQNDVLNFYRQGMCIRNGILPYSGFVFEFPPLALVFFAFPTIFTTDLTVYHWIFAGVCTFFFVIAAYLVMRMAPEGDVRLRCFAAVLFVVVILLFIRHSVNKFDPIVMALTVVALYLFSKEKWTLAYLIMAAAALTKMYPALFIVLMGAYNVMSARGGVRAVAKGTVACLAVFLAAFVPLWVAGVGFDDSLSFLTFHTDRGFQVESVAANAMMLLGKLGLVETLIVDANYTYEVAGPLADAVGSVWMYIGLIVVVAAFVFCIRCMPVDGRRWTPQQMAMAMMVVCAAFVLTNKVFSTQYTIWFFPFIAMIWYAFPSRRAARLSVIAIAMQASCLLLLPYPIDSWEFDLLVLAKNVFLIYLTLEAARVLYEGRVAGVPDRSRWRVRSGKMGATVIYAQTLTATDASYR